MANPDIILSEYAALRNAGLDKKEAVRRLRPHIEPLPKAVRDELAVQIRSFENSKDAANRTRTTTNTPSPIKPIDRPAIKPLKPTTTPKVERAYCWNCGKPNRVGEVLCVHCGAMMKQTDAAATRQLAPAGDDDTYNFTPNSVLYFHVRHSGDSIPLRPQDSDHEMIVGRADAAGVVVPDVDLSAFGAAQMGVSRMHMTMQYDRANAQIRIQDMGSANGLFVNGQRLVPQEERVLRDGDQLRLGEMMLDVAYQHH